jgi:hypothetical protein
MFGADLVQCDWRLAPMPYNGNPEWLDRRAFR